MMILYGISWDAMGTLLWEGIHHQPSDIWLRYLKIEGKTGLGQYSAQDTHRAKKAAPSKRRNTSNPPATHQKIHQTDFKL